MSTRPEVRIAGTRLPRDLHERINAELRPGERLAWTGRPGIAMALVGALFKSYVMMMCIAWGAYIFCASLPMAAEVHWLAVVAQCLFMGIPILFAGFAIMSAPYRVWRELRRTCYALTDCRAIVWEPAGRRGISVRSFHAEDLADVKRVQRPDGSGDLTFETGATDDPGAQRDTSHQGFVRIERVREVEQLVRNTLLTTPRPPKPPSAREPAARATRPDDTRRSCGEAPPPAAAAPAASVDRGSRLPVIPTWIPVVLGNAVPVLGVLFFGWDALAVVFLYWMENALIGAFTVLRMACARSGKTVGDFMRAWSGGVPPKRRKGMTQKAWEGSVKAWEKEVSDPSPSHWTVGKAVAIPLFMFHYGFFMLAHLVFIVFLLGGPAEAIARGEKVLSLPLENLAACATSVSTIVAVVLLLIEHAYAFYRDYWQPGKYKQAVAYCLVPGPYPRIVPMHFGLFLGGVLVVFLALPRYTLVLVVLLKTAFELATLPRAPQPEDTEKRTSKFSNGQ